MENNEKNSSGPIKHSRPGSFLDNVRRIEEEEKRAALEEESKAAAQKAEEEQRERRAYEEKLKKERLELMKLKQGVISENDIEKEEKVEKTYTIWEKISNFFYHNKVFLIVGGMFAAIAIFLIYDYVTTERADIQSLFIACDFEMTYKASDVSELWSSYGEDYNGDKKSVVKLYYVPALYDNEDMTTAYLVQSDRTKLMAEFQSGETIIIIGDKDAYQALGVLENAFVDARELFPDDPYAEELGYRLQGTDFKDMIGRPDMDDSKLYVSFRKPIKTMGMSEEKMQVNFDRSLSFFKNFLAEHRVEGKTLEPTPDPVPVENEYALEENGEQGS